MYVRTVPGPSIDLFIYIQCMHANKWGVANGAGFNLLHFRQAFRMHRCSALTRPLGVARHQTNVAILLHTLLQGSTQTLRFATLFELLRHRPRFNVHATDLLHRLECQKLFGRGLWFSGREWWGGSHLDRAGPPPC